MVQRRCPAQLPAVQLSRAFESRSNMERLTEQAIRRSMVNASRSEVANMVLPKDVDALEWESLDYLGWRDPKLPQRGYIAYWSDGEPVGILLRAAESRMSRRMAAMCLLCRSADSADNISLFTARRSGQAGRKGDSVGTYICTDLACSQKIRTGVPTSRDQPDPALVIDERVIGLQARLDAFMADVLRP
jgi:hypothetical protein